MRWESRAWLPDPALLPCGAWVFGFFVFDSPTTENLNGVFSRILHFFRNNNFEKLVGRYTQVLTASPGVFQGERRGLAVGATCAQHITEFPSRSRGSWGSGIPGMSGWLLLCVSCELKMVCAEQQPPDALASLLWLLEFFPEGESIGVSPGYPGEEAASASGSSVCSGESTVWCFLAEIPGG